MESALKETPRLVQASGESRREWYKSQQAIHGKEKIPDHLIEPEAPEFDPEETKGVVQVFGEFMAAPAIYEIGGLRIRVEEPTIGQIKKRLLPFLKGIDPSATPDVILAKLEGIDEFQLLIMDCVHFEDVETAPKDLLAWSDNLKASDGLTLAEALAENLDWAGMIERATAIQGKIRGVRGKAARR